MNHSPLKSLLRWTFHRRRHFRGEPFTAEVNGSPWKWLLNFLPNFLGYIEFLTQEWSKKCLSHFCGEKFTAEVTSAVNCSPGKSLPRWTIHHQSFFRGEPFTTEVKFFTLNVHNYGKRILNTILFCQCFRIIWKLNKGKRGLKSRDTVPLHIKNLLKC